MVNPGSARQTMVAFWGTKAGLSRNQTEGREAFKPKTAQDWSLALLNLPALLALKYSDRISNRSIFDAGKIG